jgi:hypothetical protein
MAAAQAHADGMHLIGNAIEHFLKTTATATAATSTSSSADGKPPAKRARRDD